MGSIPGLGRSHGVGNEYSLILSFLLIPKIVHHFWAHSCWQGLSSFNFSASASLPVTPPPLHHQCQLVHGLRANTEIPLGVVIKELFSRVKIYQSASLWDWLSLERSKPSFTLRFLSGSEDQGHQEESSWLLSLQQPTRSLNFFGQPTEGTRAGSYIHII